VARNFNRNKNQLAESLGCHFMKLSCFSLILILSAINQMVSAQTVQFPTPGPDIAPAKLVHPGIFSTEADLERIRANVAAGKEPWKSAWEALEKTGPDENFQPHVTENLTNAYMTQDQGHAAYILTIKWVASGDPKYAQAAIRIINAWSSTVKSAMGGGTMRNGIGGNQMANAAEILAHGFNGAAGWPAENVARAQKWFKEVLYPCVSTGKMRSANWGTSCLAGCMAMAIFCDDRTMFNDSAYAYENGFTNTTDGGAGIAQYIDESGENAESGRDQPHSQGGIAHLMEVAVMAYNQGVPQLLAYKDHRIITGFEYTAQYNLGNDVPYHPFTNYDGKIIYPNGISEKGRGRFSPIYEMANYYFTKAGYSAPFVRQVCESPGYRPEPTNSDHTGLGTLLYTLEATPPRAKTSL
jgi:hypothetical protein